MPTQDIVLGLYLPSLDRDNEPGEGMEFNDMGEIEHALFADAVTLHSKIKARYKTVDAEGKPITRRVQSTPGRMMLAEFLPRNPAIPFELVNRQLRKQEISHIIDEVYRHCGQKETVLFCDAAMALGFREACKAGISFGKDDMVVPEAKEKLIETRAIRCVNSSSNIWKASRPTAKNTIRWLMSGRNAPIRSRPK